MTTTKKTSETGLSEADIKAIRDEAKAVVDAEYPSQRAAARDAGMAEQTFSAWLNGTYTGRNDRTAADVQIWLRSRVERKRASASLPKGPGFIATRYAREAIDCLQAAQVAPDMAVLAGGAGVGKTTTCEHYTATNPNVWLSTMQPATSTVHTMLQTIAEAVGVTERNASKLTGAIGRRLMGTGGLLIIDEVQHLSTKALDQLRSIHDLFGIGLALVGNEQVYGRLEGGDARKPEFAQLYSRVGIRFNRPRPFGEDICSLIKAWGVEDPEAVRLLKAIASKPGALRGLNKVLRYASMLAQGDGAQLAMKHVQAAWARLGDAGLTVVQGA